MLLLTTQSIAAPKCLNEKQQADLSKFIKQCEKTELDLAFEREMLAIEQTSNMESKTNPLLLLGFGILVGSVATALIVGAHR